MVLLFTAFQAANVMGFDNVPTTSALGVDKRHSKYVIGMFCTFGDGAKTHRNINTWGVTAQ